MTGYWKSAMNKDLDFLFNSLLFSMGQEYDHYQELLVTLEVETHVLTKSTLEDILEFNKRKELLLLSLNMVSEIHLFLIRTALALGMEFLTPSPKFISAEPDTW